jgi:hypothetical protein
MEVLGDLHLMKIWARVVGASFVALACCLATGCSSSGNADKPPSTGDTSPSAAPSTTTSGSPGPLNISDLPSDPQVIWREDINYDKTAANQDLTLAPGTYEVRAVCSASAALKISANAGQRQDLACSTAYGPGLKVCITKPGLFLNLERTSDPKVDLIWQLGKAAASKCTTNAPSAPTPTGTARN